MASLSSIRSGGCGGGLNPNTRFLDIPFSPFSPEASGYSENTILTFSQILQNNNVGLLKISMFICVVYFWVLEFQERQLSSKTALTITPFYTSTSFTTLASSYYHILQGRVLALSLMPRCHSLGFLVIWR